ncbi:MAG: 3-deoxy-7-phosphoheptulonate synthase [Candidatus Eremiobacteraeota bacterium]|nr:3-deoxy-7-phosphoheptulonate synthase [Candidatus Eremiobacteraeota bacterium]MBV8355710.1 3-deoxy-7-phosphoheptulonate synthase [Candidatus Eremiobacteraeota bacterium]
MVGAFEGIDGAHSQLALDAYFRARSIQGATLGTPNFRAAAVAVSAGRADVGIVPIDNAIAGTVRDGYDLLLEFDLVPIAEIVWRMDHRLLGVPGATLDGIREVLGHPLVLAECGKFLSTLAGARVVPCEDTGIAAREVARSGSPTLAAIAPPSAAARYELVELAPRVADHPDNFTRFIVFRARGTSDPAFAIDEGDGDRKTSLVLVTSNSAGSLSACLNVVAKAGINLGKLESKPTLGRPNQSEFYVDLEADLFDPDHAQALADLRKAALEVRIIGSYRANAHVAATPPAPHVPLSVIREALPKPPKTGGSSNTPRAARDARPDGTRLRIANVEIGEGLFTIIAGPCSVESREQVLDTAFAVRDAGARMLRGGAFKPRTNPYAFQGMGWEGVALLAEAGRATGLPTVSEVMSIDQVERMAVQIDVLQVGARNMQNFDLLRAVGRTGKPVLLKRGLSASLEELLAAAEYVLAEGNPNVILCERGIRTFETATRNTLDLSAVPVLRERTHLPVIVDPSHGVGVRRWIAPLCRAAKAVGAHGIIVEVHPNPPEALSDKEQALTFEDFRQITEELERVPIFGLVEA